MKRKIAISACLLGELCRYDGTTKSNASVIDKFKDDEIIPFCPEAPVLGTPRERISVIEQDGKRAIIGDESGKDFTEAILSQVALLINDHPDLDMIVLKSKSPSCGLGTTPILNVDRDVISFSNGIAAQKLKEKYPNLLIVDEHYINQGE